jgi:hypothetical protein
MFNMLGGGALSLVVRVPEYLGTWFRGSVRFVRPFVNVNALKCRLFVLSSVSLCVLNRRRMS